MNIDELTLGQVREISKLTGTQRGDEHAYQIGKAYIIRTVTHYLTGRLTRVTAQELVLEDAAWVVDTGRWASALANGELSEIEPFPDGPVIVGRGAVIDAALWSFALPRVVK